jgi:CubicO group peptidase (beta-lactamase class C family)
MLDSTTLQSVLRLAPPPGRKLADRFETITLRHMLESTSGIDNGVIRDSLAAATAFHQPPQLPCTREQLVRYGATFKLANQPGDPKSVRYGNASYLMLGEVVAKLSGLGAGATFESAIEHWLMQPLQMKRVRSARSLIRDQLPDEASYHLSKFAPPDADTALPVSRSLRSAARPLVHGLYGGDGAGSHIGAMDLENFSSTGGLSAAAVDVARIIASLSLQANNPALEADTLDEWLNNAATASRTLKGPSAHGYHGWDGVAAVDPGKRIFAGNKGGALPGTGAWAEFRTNGVGYINAVNGSTRTGVKTEWLKPLKQVLARHEWGNVDLFPQFGMPSFPPG